jgi:HEPN domain-containing protein
MIPNQTLKYLITSRIKDATTLLHHQRYPAAIYMAGYAVEIALKSKICRSLQFNHGFPETKQELNAYLTSINRATPQPLIINLGDIRNHNLHKLLFYSGEETTIKNNFFREWVIVAQWTPEDRYKKMRIFKYNAETFLKSTRKIIKEIS